MVVAEARGSMRVMCRADVPTAMRFKDGNAERERRAWDVVRVSTSDEVGRSHVRSVWSQETEYATVGSLGANMVSETGAECDFRTVIGPR